MPKTRLFDREGSNNVKIANQGQVQAEFNSARVAEVDFEVGAGGEVDLSLLLSRYPSVFELGRPGLALVESDDLSAESEITVPTGKFWRVIGGFLAYTASADVATRTPIVTLEQAGGTAYETFTLATKVADDVENEHFLCGSNGLVEGTRGVAAQGTLTMDTKPTDGDTLTIDDVTYTFVDDDDGSTTNAVAIGATLATSKTALEAKLVDGQHPTVNAAAFSGDDMVLTARDKGTAGNSIATTETFTAGTNVFDAATLGTTTAGVDEADVIGSEDFPDGGPLLSAGEKVALNVTNGHANDVAELAVFFIEYDQDPTT